MDEIDQIYDEYEIASQISQTDFSHLTIDDFAMVEYDSEGAPYGMVMGVPVAINTKPPAKEPMQAEQPAQAEPSGSIGQDIDRGLVRGVQKASEALGDTLPLLGTPVDLVNKGLQEVGELIGVDLGSDKPVLGSEMIRDGVQAVIEFGNNLIPQQANEAYAEYVNQPPSSPVVQGLVEEATRFGVQAVTPAMYLKAFTVMSPFVRGLAWGGIADFINAQPSDEGAISAITKMVAGATPEERGAVANAIMQVVEKQESDPLIISKAREALDGMILGSSIEKGVELLVKAARQIPVDQLRQRIVDAGARADDRLKSTMRGTTLSANPVGAMGDMAVSAAGRLARTDDETAPVFFSAVSNAVDALPMEKGGGDQMRAMIAKGEGVKAEEMAWIGLDDFLKGKKSVTKQEVRDYVEANQVRVEEVVKDSDKVDQAAISDLNKNLLDGRISREVYLQRLSVLEANYPKFGPDDYPDLSLPGGENYREVLLRLPEQPVSGARYAIKSADGDNVPSNATTREEAIAEAGGDASKVIEIIGDDTVNPNFTGGHMNESNVLAHLRLTDRTGPNGEKILFIEEIQSDWHQMGRKKGYKKETSNLDRELDFVEKQLDELAPKSKANKDHIDAGGDRSELPFPDIGRDIENFMDRRSELVSEMAKFKDGVPDAPLKKNWHEMSFRRVARMAAEEGYDRIAWTPGKMQAERYDLSKQIDELRAIRNDDGTFRIYGVENRTGPAGILMEQDNVKPADLENLVGKHLAEKIRGQNKVEEAYFDTDLQVGGEGMKGFYDKMLKSYASKWGKKFGSKVGVTEIETAKIRGVDPEREGGMDELLGQREIRVEDYGEGSPEVAEIDREIASVQEVVGPGPSEKVWSMPVTKKMKDSVLKKGVPFFGVAGATAVGIQDDKQPAS